MPNVKVANPAGHLLLVNGGTKMQKKRKANPSSSHAKRVTVRVNGKRGHRTTARRRRSNPSSLVGIGLLKEGTAAAFGSMATTFVRGLIPIQFGGAIGEAAITALVGIGLGELTNMVFKSDKNIGKAVAIGGISAASSNLLTNYGLTPQALLAPRPQPVLVKKGVNGFGEIVSLRGGGNDPYWGATRGMGEIVTVHR